MTKTRLVYLMVVVALIAGCIQISMQDEKPTIKLLEIVLVTHTPQSTLLTHTPVPSPTITSTPTSTSTMTPTLTPTVTEETDPIEATVNLTANCRFGPDIIYKVSDYLFPGDQILIVGRNADSSWWLIRKDSDIDHCWVTAKAITLDENPEGLSIIPAPPTPTAIFPLSPTSTATRKPKPPAPYPPPPSTPQPPYP